MPLRPTLDKCLERLACAPGELLLVAFSGGPDSTALLGGLGAIAGERGLRLHAAHLDHGADPDSARRAEAARKLADALDVRCTIGLRPAERTAPRESREAGARRRRYGFLHRLAEEVGARFILTAHHADDQAETVLLRLLYGSGIEGLGGIRPRRGRVIRPLLELRRRSLRSPLAGLGLDPVHDPTNDDLSTPRNRIRHLLLPQLEAEDPAIVPRLCRLAERSAATRRRLAQRLAPRLDLTRAAAGEAAIDRRAFAALPATLRPFALALLHRAAGAPYPAPATARVELLRQLASSRQVGCDCGGGWRWEAHGGRLRLVRPADPGDRFTYTRAESSPAGAGYRQWR